MAPDDRTLTRVAIVSWALGAVAAAVALLVATRWTALSVASGAALATLNFEALRRLGKRLVVPGRGRPAIALVLVLKVAVLFSVLYVLVVKVALDGVAVAAGASALVLAIVFEGLRSSLAPVEERA